jgi:hypothetical protein
VPAAPEDAPLLRSQDPPVALSTLAKLRSLESVWLNDAPVEVDQIALRLPRLRELRSLRLKRDQVEALRRANPGLKL